MADTIVNPTADETAASCGSGRGYWGISLSGCAIFLILMRFPA